MIGETLGRGVLDSRCTKTVSGELWMEDYLSVLPEESMKTVKTSNNTNSVYHFDDRKESKAIQNVGIPVATGDNQYT